MIKCQNDYTGHNKWFYVKDDDYDWKNYGAEFDPRIQYPIQKNRGYNCNKECYNLSVGWWRAKYESSEEKCIAWNKKC